MISQRSIQIEQSHWDSFMGIEVPVHTGAETAKNTI
jgi:hypothetical protein